MTNAIKVTVFYTDELNQPRTRHIELEEGACVRDALALVNITTLLNGHSRAVGVFGKKKGLGDLLQEGDRVEVYRPLKVDPKVARQRRVEKQRREQPNRWIRR